MRAQILRRRGEPVGESRRSRLVPCSLDDVCNALVLQRRRRRLLREQMLSVMLLLAGLIYTLVGRRLRDRAIRLTMLDRLVEQDEVPLVGREIEVL